MLDRANYCMQLIAFSPENDDLFFALTFLYTSAKREGCQCFLKSEVG